VNPPITKQPIREYYQCPRELLDFHIAGTLEASSGFFRFGQDLICYGQTSAYTCPTINGHLYDTSEYVRRHVHTGVLPFDPAQIVDNLRYERYVSHVRQQGRVPNRCG
jgi:hypothetical protein